MKKQKKKKSTQSPLKGKAPIPNLDSYRKKLEAMRDDLLRTMQKKREEAIPDSEVGDEGDVAAQSVARDLTFELTNNESRLLEEVEAALRRIENGTYGYCEATGERISAARLKYIPYARYSIKYQSQIESR